MSFKLPAFDPTDSKSYDALCHCGTVQFTVDLSPPLERHTINECNCSICTRNGYLLVYPRVEQFKITAGEDALRTYTFGSKMNQHHFCGHCGSAVFFNPQMPKRGQDIDIRGVNIRMFKGIDVTKFETKKIDGWNFFPFVDSDYLKPDAEKST